MIDSHCHMDAPAFNTDRSAILASARERGVKKIIAPATHAAAWATLHEITQIYPEIYPAYGLHPMFMAQHKKADLKALEDWISHAHPVAIGECGLDFYHSRDHAKSQTDYFEAQLAVAQNAHLPVIIHARKATEAVLLILKKFPDLRGVVHSFSGSREQAQRLIEQGFYLGFGGPVTWPHARRLQQVVASLPLDAILLETDAPDQPDNTHRGERNEPGYLIYIAKAIAQLTETDLNTVIATTTQNAHNLFGLTWTHNNEPAC